MTNHSYMRIIYASEDTILSESFLAIHEITKSFGSGDSKVQVLKGINLEIEKGEFCVLLGPSGSGKSTLLRCATFLETIDGGEILYMGKRAAHTDESGKAVYVHHKELREFRSYCGLVFQQFNLFPHYNVLQNLTDAPVEVQHRSKEEAEQTAMELLAKMGIADKAKAYPYQLSGGQQQRVAIARALAMKPEILFFDEPTSALDPELIGEVLDVMRDLANDGMTMLVVTHEMNFAENVSNQVIFMTDGQVIESGPADEFFKMPKQERTREFLNRMSR